MLRVLVISLFVANLLLLGFQCSKPAVSPEPEAVRSAVRDTGIPTIHLFSEMTEDQDLMSGNRMCFTLGPFHSSEDKDNIQLLLQEVSTRISERQTEAVVEKGYWVFIPPYTSLLEANQALISLQALGLEDIGVVYDGDWKNAVSLGYFMRQENAFRRKESLEERGYAALMRVQRQSEPRYWLDYEQTPGSGLIALDMQNRPNDFMQRPMPCPEQELLEVAETESQDLVEVPAQLQIPAVEEESVGGQGEDPESSEPIESAPEEPVEDLPDEAAEAAAEEVSEDQPEQAVETGDQERIEDQPVQAVGTGPEDGVGDTPEQSDSAGPGSDVETGTGEG